MPETPPVAPRKPHTWDRPTGPVEDPWAWLLDRDDPDTVAYLEAENAYTEAWLAPHAELIETVFSEIKSRIQETDVSVPSRKGDWYYVSRTEEGASYPIHCRGTNAAMAADTTLLDENVEADGHEYFALGAYDVSPSHQLLAYAVDFDGSEEYELRFRDLRTGADLPERIERVYYGTAWAAGSDVLFYVRPDDQMRPFQIWRHRLGTEVADDVLVLQEDDERFFVSVELTRDERMIVFQADSKTTSEAWFVPADATEQEPIALLGRRDGHEYGADHWTDRWVYLSNDGAEDFQVLVAPDADPTATERLVPHVSGRRINSADPFAGHLVLHEWSDARQQIRILFTDGTERTLDLGDTPAEIELGANPEYETSLVRFSYQALATPETIYDEDVRTAERTVLKQQPVPSTDLSLYRSERRWATSADGVRVPVDLVWRDGTAPNGTAPVLLYGYGAYESSIPPYFSVARLSLLDRGWVFALAHPRGGGELGRRWYLDGKLLAKRNSFADLIACAEHLVTEGVAAANRITIRGGSAGGLLVGAAMALRPELFAAVVAQVPFVDIVSTMSDPSLPLTVTEWEEWGDPRVEPYASYMASYSPYDNVEAREYPTMFVSAGLNDPRVSYHEPAKWVAKLRSLRTDDRPMLLKTEMGAGHGGPSGRYDAWREEAEVLAFLIATV